MSFFSRDSWLPRVNCSFPSLRRLPCLGSVVDEVEANMKSPREIAVFGAMTALSIAIQGGANIKKPTGQSVPVSLFMLVIADSGERKSSTENVFIKPLREYQAEQDLVWSEQIKGWEAKMLVWEERRRSIARSIAKAVRDGGEELALEEQLKRVIDERPVRPRRCRLLYDDATSESLMLGLYQDLPAAGLVSSEANLKNRAFNDLQKQNALWSGDAIAIDRKSSESFELRDVRLTVSFMTQPAAFEKYIRVQGELLRGAGLWARFLVCQPRSTQGERLLDSPTQSWDHIKVFEAKIKSLLDDSLKFLESGRRELSFSPDASDAWVQIFNEVESEIRDCGRFEGAGDMASKLLDNISRVAALVSVFERGWDEDVDIDSLLFAVKLCSWCSDEFYRIFLPPKECELDAECLLEWLEWKRDVGRVEILKSELLQYGPNRLRKKGRLDAALDILISEGKVDIYKSGGRTFVYFAGV